MKLRFGPIIIVMLATLVALVLGLATAVLPKIFVAALAGLVICLPVYIWRPAWLIVPTIAVQMYLPSQPMADVITVIFIARAAVTLAGSWTKHGALFKQRLMTPVVLIAICVLVSFVAAVTVLQHSKSPVYQDGRVFVYWLWFVPFLAFAPAKNAAEWVAKQLLGVAVVVSILAVVQGASGISLVSTGRVGQLETLGQLSAGITRVQIPGFVFVTFGAFLCLAQLVKQKGDQWWWVYFPLLALFSLALFYNFGRAIWFWTVLGMAITAICLGWRGSVKFGLWGLTAFIILGSALIVTKPQMIEIMTDRISSVFKEGGGKTSYGWREVENSNARKRLAETKLLGTGLGGEYRSAVIGLRAFENHTWYIHNGHFSLMLKLSVLGYLAYLWLGLRLIKEAWRMRVEIAAAPYAAASIAWALTFFGQNITQPDIMSAHGLTMLVGVLSILLLLRQQTLSSKVAPNTDELTATRPSFGMRPLRTIQRSIGAP